MKFSSHKSLGGVSTTSISSFLFRRTKSTVSRIQFSARCKTDSKQTLALRQASEESAGFLLSFFCDD